MILQQKLKPKVIILLHVLPAPNCQQRYAKSGGIPDTGIWQGTLQIYFGKCSLPSEQIIVFRFQAAVRAVMN